MNRAVLKGSNRRVIGFHLYSAPSKTTTVSLANLETRWATLSPTERTVITKHIEQIQLGDWKVLTAEQRKGAYYIAFGVHGSRTPVTKPGHYVKMVAGVAGVVSVSMALMHVAHVSGAETPKTLSPKWREKSTEYMRNQNSNPISGISSESYRGNGM